MLRFGDRLAAMLARSVSWSPIGEHLLITIDDSADARLTRVHVSGVVRACRISAGGLPEDLLIELNGPISYAGHYVAADIKWLVARPCLRFHRTTRLLLSWMVARLIEAPSFVDATYARTIGIGRLCETLGTTASYELTRPCKAEP